MTCNLLLLARLKMGVCEGTPNSIQPDHLGRADYHGESINLAARFMDAAAHGGQVGTGDLAGSQACWLLSLWSARAMQAACSGRA